jgi:hypothetical protein
MGLGGSSSVVERLLAKEEVVGPNPIFRSRKNSIPKKIKDFLGYLWRRRSQEVKARVCKTLIRRFESARRLFIAGVAKWQTPRT